MEIYQNYEDDVISLMKKWNTNLRAGPSETVENYFNSHHDRFTAGIMLLHKNIQFNESFKIHELGSNFPYFSLPFVRKYGCTVEVSSLQNVPFFMDKNICIRYSNMCFDDFGTELYDLTITTEVLEHLPCNAVNARDKSIKSIKKGGYWFVSFPLGKTNSSTEIDTYKKQLEEHNPYEYSEKHLREFTPESINKFLQIDNFKIIDSVLSLGWISQHLLKRIN